MSQEIIYTSAPQGLRPGSFGFCTVASTPGMASSLADRLESLSGYRHLYPPGDPRANRNPIVFSHYVLKVGGQKLHILSRIADAGLDYSQRTNKLAHHIALDPSEIVAGGPAWLLLQPGFMETNWSGSPRTIPSGRRPPAGDPPGKACQHWAQVTGDSGWGGVLAQNGMVAGPAAYVIFPEGMNPLPLIQEALSLLPPHKRWDISFSTFFSRLPAGVECQWRFVMAGTPEAAQAFGSRGDLVIDLTRKLGPPPASMWVDAARSGISPKFEEPPVRGPVNAPTGPIRRPVAPPTPVPGDDLQGPPLRLQPATPLGPPSINPSLPPRLPSGSKGKGRGWIKYAAIGLFAGFFITAVGIVGYYMGKRDLPVANVPPPVAPVPEPPVEEPPIEKPDNPPAAETPAVDEALEQLPSTPPPVEPEAAKPKPEKHHEDPPPPPKPPEPAPKEPKVELTDFGPKPVEGVILPATPRLGESEKLFPMCLVRCENVNFPPLKEISIEGGVFSFVKFETQQNEPGEYKVIAKSTNNPTGHKHIANIAVLTEKRKFEVTWQWTKMADKREQILRDLVLFTVLRLKFANEQERFVYVSDNGLTFPTVVLKEGSGRSEPFELPLIPKEDVKLLMHVGPAIGTFEGKQDGKSWEINTDGSLALKITVRSGPTEDSSADCLRVVVDMHTKNDGDKPFRSHIQQLQRNIVSIRDAKENLKSANSRLENAKKRKDSAKKNSPDFDMAETDEQGAKKEVQKYERELTQIYKLFPELEDESNHSIITKLNEEGIRLDFEIYREVKIGGESIRVPLVTFGSLDGQDKPVPEPDDTVVQQKESFEFSD